MVEQVALSLVEEVLAQYLKRILDKATKGKRLSDGEIGMLFMDYNRRSLEERLKKVEERLNRVEEKVESLETGLRNDMKSLEESLRSDMKSLEESLRNDMKNLEEGLRSDMAKLEKKFTEDIAKLEKRVTEDINRLESSIDYLKKSLDQLRDNVINVLLEELKRRMKENP